MELGSYFLFLQEQIKDIIIILAPVRTSTKWCVCLLPFQLPWAGLCLRVCLLCVFITVVPNTKLFACLFLQYLQYLLQSCSRVFNVVCVCVFYYCRTYYKAVRVGGGGEWRTCAMRDDEPRPVWIAWMSLPITHYN